MYDRPPETSAELVHPPTYDGGRYGNATLTDRSDRDWERVTVRNGTAHASIGEAGLASMFAYTLRDRHRPNRAVVDREAFHNREDGRLDPRRPFTYDLAAAEGWDADRLHAYAGDGGTAYVWNVTFVDRANATEFRDGYGRLLAYWGADRRSVDDGTVWTFDGSSTFRGAIWVRRNGASLTVVKAPSAAELDDVYAPAPGA